MIQLDSILSFLNKENYYAKVSALFRVSICLVLIIDFLFHIESVKDFYSLDTWFISVNQTPFLNYVREYIGVFFFIYFVLLIFYLLGIGRNVTALAFLIVVILKQNITPEVINWIDHILRITLFLMIFVNSYSYLSVIKYEKPIFDIDQSTSNLISNLGVYLIIGHIFLIYTDNGIAKLFERDWQNGQAFYFSVKHVWVEGTSLNNPLADNIYVSAIATYGTLLSQVLFVPLVLFKPTKNFIIYITILFHAILAVCFYIYKFQAVMILLHLFLYTDKEMLRAKFLSKYWKTS
ncbi:hypothetical protein UJ101_01889 [Flavobacteriaceae bacterium UJ101]|nr:hypothetical protein UJ101_01889 [Flavobacteriaceae bacterium UJ101]